MVGPEDYSGAENYCLVRLLAHFSNVCGDSDENKLMHIDYRYRTLDNDIMTVTGFCIY